MMNFQNVIERWPSKSLLAEAIAESPSAVRMWWSRNLIPGRKLQAVADAAERAGFSDITYAVLCNIHLAARMAKAKAHVIEH